MKNMPQQNISVIGNTRKGHHYWIGKIDNDTDYFAGQTFKSNKKGFLKSISIFPEMIIGETDVLLSIFEFDEYNHEWKEKKYENRIMLKSNQQNQWISFEIDNITLDEEKQYAFKLSCNHGGIMAIAEGPWVEKDPYPDGEQWLGTSKNPKGNFYKNHDLAFSAEIHHI